MNLDKPWLRFYPEEVPSTLEYPNKNIVNLLLDAVASYPNKPAVYFLGKTMSYRELLTSVYRMSNGLHQLGVSKGDRVAIMLPNCPQAVIAYFAVLFTGAVVVQTNPLYVERELQHQLQDCGASVIVILDLLYERLGRIRDNGMLPQLKHVIVTSIKDGLPFPKNLLYPLKQRKEGHRPNVPYGQKGVITYKHILGNSPSTPIPVSVNSSDELALLQYTGGTTGLPKGVMLTHRNLIANSLQTAAWCYRAKSGQERFLAALPLFHVFGLTVLMNQTVLRAGMMILLPRFEINMVLEAIKKLHPTIFPGAPTMYIALLNHPDTAISDLSSIEVCISGSAALPLEIQERFEMLSGGRLIEGYGLTEAAPVTHCNPIWGLRKNRTIGVPLPDTEAAVVDSATGEPVALGEIGELVIRGPQVMMGYWNRSEETAAALRDGWLFTGDLATMDEDGYFTIVDRKKDVIIAGGYNIYPREVEEVLFEHPAVMEAAVVGVNDPYRGETVKAFIVTKEGWNVSTMQLDRWCRDRLAAYKVPRNYVIRDSLPKSMIGKVLRRKLLEEDEE
ncbi:long-chain-fatty-acid--CoA ligase [Paenibacillus abyssi]|uniref:Long-chain-fatty-acid--CoA ligase n=1 Tax=Paenibacillus abyssi TaxID=1340531 RepID=A0A917G0D0_9BACL|nr:long-chain fatty acid--CoA ligase [Paenibacillus abyssi]GGG16217.1 long-chain-fatty-acid--CoA ligase [Paenibacillus abyssi]